MARLSSLDKIRLVRKGMGNPASGDITDEDIGIYLHQAMQELVMEHKFPSMTSYEDVTADGTNSDYDLTATDVLSILYPANNVTANVPMKLMDLQWDRRFGTYYGSGTTIYYLPVSLSGGSCTIRLRPVPAAGVVCRIPYLMIPEEPGTTEATENFSELPQSFDLAEVSRAAEIGLQSSYDKVSAGKEAGLGGRRQMIAERNMPHSAFHKNRPSNFQQRINRRK